MFFFCLALICLIRSSLAVDLFIYKSFTEIRQPHNGVGEYTYEFTSADYGNLIDESISWDGTPLDRQEVYSTDESLQGTTVLVRRSSKCGCETIQAKIVDPDSLLLQNVKTGAYFYADKQSIEYTTTQPGAGKTAVTFQFKNKTAEHNGILSYLMKGITWKPSYDLLLTGTNDCKVRAYANIKNDHQREYTVAKTYLLGGDVQLASNSFKPVHGFESEKFMSSLKPIQIEGEQNGLYSYSLNDGYTLRPSSSIRLPFIDIAAKYRFYYKTSANIAAGQYQGVFEKNYDLTADRFMPAGIITVRDNQLLVGQSNLPDVPENYTQTISVGQDNDIRYMVKGNLTSKSDEKDPVAVETYELDVELINLKNKNVDAQLDLSGGVQMTLLGTTCNTAKLNGNQLNLLVQLEKGEHRLCKFNVRVRLN